MGYYPTRVTPSMRDRLRRNAAIAVKNLDDLKAMNSFLQVGVNPKYDTWLDNPDAEKWISVKVGIDYNTVGHAAILAFIQTRLADKLKALAPGMIRDLLRDFENDADNICSTLLHGMESRFDPSKPKPDQREGDPLLVEVPKDGAP